MAPLRIDVLFQIAGVDFEDCYARRIETDIGDLVVNFISLEDLIVNKETAGRHQDLADAEKLRISQAREKQRATDY